MWSLGFFESYRGTYLMINVFFWHPIILIFCILLHSIWITSMVVKFPLSWWTPSIHMRRLWRHCENTMHIMLRLSVSIRAVIHVLWKNLCFLCLGLWAWRNLMLNGESSVRHWRHERSCLPSCLPAYLPNASLPLFLLASFCPCFLPACLPACLESLPFGDSIKSGGL